MHVTRSGRSFAFFISEKVARTAFRSPTRPCPLMRMHDVTAPSGTAAARSSSTSASHTSIRPMFAQRLRTMPASRSSTRSRGCAAPSRSSSTACASCEVEASPWSIASSSVRDVPADSRYTYHRGELSIGSAPRARYAARNDGTNLTAGDAYADDGPGSPNVGGGAGGLVSVRLSATPSPARLRTSISGWANSFLDARWPPYNRSTSRRRR